jgi:hypothetical protein
MNIISMFVMSLLLGKYIPAVSYTIHTRNPGAKQHINLKGKNKITTVSLIILHRETVDLYIVDCPNGLSSW